MLRKSVVGWDLGGAHVKAVLLDENADVLRTLQTPCPLWQGLAQLENALEKTINEFDTAVTRHAITMTGELVDLFPSRVEGVARIIETTVKLLGTQVLVFAGKKGLLESKDAVSESDNVASANWLATSSLVASKLDQGLVVDIGSTTTDMVVIINGRVCTRSQSDHERLISDELVYSGVVRTPLMALAQRVPFCGRSVGLMAEHFATMADVYRLTGELPEYADQTPTADGRPKTREDSARRLARMLGKDFEAEALPNWIQVAEWFAEQQLNRLEAAYERLQFNSLANQTAPVVGAGVGGFVARRLAATLGRPYIDFSDLVETAPEHKTWVSYCAPAYAVAALAHARDGL